METGSHDRREPASVDPAEAPGSPDRRTILKGLALAAGGSVAPALFMSAARAATTSAPVVETAAGRLRGLHVDGVDVFKQVHYAASTGGANPVFPPPPPHAWGGG